MTNAFLDLLNYEEVCQLFLAKNSYETVFIELEKLCSVEGRLMEREKLIQSMFVKAVKSCEDSIALHMSMEYISVLRRSVATIVPPLLSKISKEASHFNEVHLWLLLRLQPKFHFKHAFTFI